MNQLIHDRNNRIAISTFSISKNENLIDLLNVNELDKIKTKKKFRESKNKKKTQIRAKKTTIRFIKRDFSKFEHVKRKYEIQTKRVKKNIVDESTKNEKRDKNQKREKNDRKRDDREREKRDEKQREQKHHKNVETSTNQSIEKIVIFTFDKFVRKQSNEQLNQRLKNHEKNFMILNNDNNDSDYVTKNFENE